MPHQLLRNMCLNHDLRITLSSLFLTEHSFFENQLNRNSIRAQPPLCHNLSGYNPNVALAYWQANPFHQPIRSEILLGISYWLV